MKIQVVAINNYSFKSKLDIPKSSKIVEVQKNNYIEELKTSYIANIFNNFDENLRKTMETFIYMIKY